MPSLNVINLEILSTNQISTISGSTCNLDLLTYAVTVKELKTGGIFTASNLSSLPAASTSTGTLYFVDSERTIYWATTSTGWAPLVSGTANELWGWGSNSFGQIGDSTTINRCSPVREFCSSNDWCLVSAKDGCLKTAIKVSGQIWVWGINQNGSLGIGDGTILCRLSPIREFCSATDWCKVDTSNKRTLALKTDNQIWSWGNNGGGILGDGTTINRCSPVREFCSATDWCTLSAGVYHSTAIKTTGQLWSWGYNCSGSLGIGNSDTTARISPVREFCSATDWCQVSAGVNSTAAVKITGQLWSWGNNGSGQLGIGSATVSECSPIREFCSATDWCYVDILFQTYAIKTTGQLWSWGNNSRGTLGNGNTNNSCSPVREFCSATDWCLVSASSSNVSAIKTSGQMWVWGDNCNGQLGIGVVDTISRCSPIREFCSASDWCMVSSSVQGSNAIKAKRFE